jgi:hypothetical protein
MLREQKRMLLKILSVLILTLNSLVALAEAESLVFGDYVGKIYDGGSGSLGKRFDPEVTMSCKYFNCEYKRKNADTNTSFDDEWSFNIRNDEMTDEQKITVTKDAWKIDEEFGEIKMKTSISLFLRLTDKNYESLCVLGHDYPDMTGMIRVDKNPPLETKENGCLQLTKNLDDQLRSGSKITIRGSKFPYRGAETQVIDLGGYSEMSDFLRSRRK